MFIGGPIMNKAVRRLCKFPNGSNNSTIAHCSSSVEFDLDFNSTDDEINKKSKIILLFLLNIILLFCYFIFLDTFFKIGPHVFKEENEAVVFTLPLMRYDDINNNNGNIDNTPAMGVIVHANSLEGYLHVSRLAWSVVPPMVRAPFANYIPGNNKYNKI
jgi:hypothetical protein